MLEASLLHGQFLPFFFLTHSFTQSADLLSLLGLNYDFWLALGSKTFDDGFHQAKWKIEILPQLFFGQLAERFNSVNHVIFQDV